jgi:uncharacterized protein
MTGALRNATPRAQPTLIRGVITHVRLRPTRNAFTYPACCLSMPLDALAALPAAGIALNRAGLVSFHERDHGAGDGSSLQTWIDELLARNGIVDAGEVTLHTFPRVLGYVFNPVSFWVCRTRSGVVRAVVAEVNNTFGERHLYLLAHRDGTSLASGEAIEASKAFHVSPFCEVRGRYRFRFQFDGARWVARIDYYDDERASHPLLTTCISGERVALAPDTARTVLLRYGWMTALVIARIHWQALRLWVKRVPWFAKPQPPARILTRS